MENLNDLQTALNHFNLFYKNINDLIKLNKKANKKLIGHSIFKKSDNALFNFLEATALTAASLVGCVILKRYNLLPYDLFLTAGATCIVSGILATVCNNIIYHINNHANGPIGRTYAQMQCDEYFVCLNQFIKKDFKALLSNTASNEKKTETFIDFANTLNNVACNLQFAYENLCNKVERFSEKKQKKWQPIIKHIEEYSLYLLNNAEKFNAYAKKLQINENAFLIKTSESLNDLIVSRDRQHSSEFLEFKKYLVNKKLIDEMEQQLENRTKKRLNQNDVSLEDEDKTF